MIGPWIHALWKRGAFQVGKEEFLSYWESQGKLKHNENNRTTVGEGANYTVTSGKDGYIETAFASVRKKAYCIEFITFCP